VELLVRAIETDVDKRGEEVARARQGGLLKRRGAE
jgi:hypothetical protein